MATTKGTTKSRAKTTRKKTTTKKSVSSLSKKEKEIRDESKQFVNDFFGDVKIDIKDDDVVKIAEQLKEKQNKPKTTGSKKNLSFLEKEMERLGDLNESLEKELAQSKEDYKKLMKQKGDSNSSVNKEVNEKILRSVQSIYIEMKNNLTGNNSTRTPYKNVSVEHMIRRFEASFPFLKNM